jgi:unsaturated rhamnogalacturonyl hydrolase
MASSDPLDLGPEGLARLRRAADLLARYRFQVWHYGDSIGFEGLLAAADVLDDARYEGWVHGALKAWAPRAEPFRELDNTAPGHAMCLAFERTGDEAILEAAAPLAAFLRDRPRIAGAPVSFARSPLREPYGGEALPADEADLLADPGPGVFVDCLHFDPPFNAHLGALAGDDALRTAAVEDALAYLRLLQDERGLVWHFWLERSGRPYAYAWSRGQGWALLGLLDLLEHAPSEEVAARFRRVAAALAAHQRDDGGWYAVADDPASGDETSTSAFAAAAYASGVLRGLLDDDFASRARAAWRHAWERVDGRGVLTGVSAAVWASTRPSHYRHVPTGFVVPWGQGVLLLAAARMGQLA